MNAVGQESSNWGEPHLQSSSAAFRRQLYPAPILILKKLNNCSLAPVHVS